MIYGNNGSASTSVKLYGEVADNFLESVGVIIFDDGDIAIGESIFDLSTGCDILEENGIVLCEDCVVLECPEYGMNNICISESNKEIFARHRADMAKSRLKTATDRAEISRKTSHALADKKADEKGYDNDRRMGMHKAIDSDRDKRINRANSKYKKRMEKIQKKYGINSESTIFSDIEII